MIKVMVAEDNIDENSMFCKVLTKDENIKVVSYTLDGEKTIEEYFERKPDVLLLDLCMPKVNGLDIINILSSYEEEKSERIKTNAQYQTYLLGTAEDNKRHWWKFWDKNNSIK